MASKEQIPTLTGELVKHQEGFKVLSTEDAQAAILDMPAFIACACAAWKNRDNVTAAVVAVQPQTDEEQSADWQKFYVEVLGYADTEPLNLTMPPARAGFGWTVVIRKGLTLNKVLEAMRAKFTVYSYIGDDLDTGVPNNDRVADKDYAIRIRDRVEADEELKNRSANWLSKENVVTMTLLERLVLELFYFWKVGPQADLNKAHLDVSNVTLCAGSRDSDGGVPDVGWNSDDREVGISWCNPGRSGGSLRARAAVAG